MDEFSYIATSIGPTLGQGRVAIAYMMTSWHGDAFRITGALWGEFTHEAPVVGSCDVSIVVISEKLWNKQSGCRWLVKP